MKPSYLARVIKIGLLTTTALTANAFAEEDKIETIVVTGQKIDRQLQETPTSVAVISEQQLEDELLLDLYDVIDQVPNVSGTFGNDFSIRGINAFNVSGSGSSYLASVYVDGAALPYRMIQQGGFSVWDLEQIEVLRGPQSTLQGRNALAGAIWMTTRQPTYEWEGKGRVTVGEHGQREYAVAVGGELVENQVAFRFSGEKNDFEGQNKNITRNDYTDHNDNETYRLKFLFEPEAIEGLNAILSYTYNESDIGVTTVSPLSTFNNRFNVFDDQTLETTENNLLSLTINYDFNDEWSLEAVSNYIDSDYTYHWDSDQSPTVYDPLLDDRNDKTKSQEIRLIYQGDKLKAVFGGYYSDLDVMDDYAGPRIYSFEELSIQPTVEALLTSYGIPTPEQMTQQVLALYTANGFDPVIASSSGSLNQSITSAALYAEFDYRTNDSWGVYGGLRYDYEKQERSSSTLTTIDNDELMPDPMAVAAVYGAQFGQLIGLLNQEFYGLASDATGVEAPVDDSFSELLPKLGVSYFINDDMSAHLTYQRGYRSGGVGRNIANNEIYTYDSEYTNNYELSLRSVWLDGDLVVNSNAFFLDWNNMQVEVQGETANGFDRYTVNAGASEVKGFEVESFYTMTDELKFNLGIGYAHSEFTKFVDRRGRDYTGQAFAGAPEWTANIGATYNHDSGFFANLNANYQNSSADRLVAAGTEAPTNDARTVVNARLGYNWDNYGIFVNAKNLLDEDYINGADTSLGAIEFGAERQLSVTLTGQF